ncbi:MAG: L,D-transpeptidase family protein [Actinobacteria bacterium]|nr:L,D-transpeptidase family protein [Actinomycetota bacterium]
MFKFLKKWIGSIITVILFLLILVFAGKMIIFPAGNLEAAQKQSETNEVDNMNNPADNNEGYNKAYFTETNNLDYSDEVTVESISEGDGSMDNIAGESEEDEDTFKEEAGEEQNIDFSNSDDFRIEVDLGKQMVFVYYKDNMIRDMICSGGADQTPTPLGEFKTSKKIEWSFIDRFNMGAYYWIRFYKKYLFHSVPFDENKEMIMEEYEKLGSPASHGCIRLELDEAEWLYEKLPLGVTVRIHE